MKKGPCIKESRKSKKNTCKKNACKSYSDESHSDSSHSNSSYSGSSHSGYREEGRLVRAELASELSAHVGECALVVLDAAQLNILNQVFRPIMCGQIAEVGNEYLVLHNVNIKMSNAPEFIFPTDLIIPLVKIVWFTAPFNCSVRFSLY